MKTELCLMMGQPGSGKSTFLKQNIGHDSRISKIVSRDAIRFSLVKEHEEYFSKEKQVFATFINELNNAAGKVDIVYADATHLNRNSRAKLLRNINYNAFDKISVLWIKTSLRTSLAQNENRKGTRAYVPPEVVRKMFFSIEPPSKEEGFSDIYIKEIK